MTALAMVKQSDLRRFADVAREKNVWIEIECNGVIIKVSPERPESPDLAKKKVFRL